MNRINYEQTGGFPLDTTNLNFLQNGFRLLNAFGDLAGNKAIISGCQISGNTVSDGVVYIDGEIFEFRGGTLGTSVIIKEEAVSGTFEDGSFKPIEITRYATFGSSLPEKTFAWADFKRIKNLFELDNEKATKTALENAISVLNTAVETAKTEIQRTVSEAKQRIDNHLLDHNNPHQVSAEQVGILKVESIKLGDVAARKIGDSFVTNFCTISVIGRAGMDEFWRITFNTPLRTSWYNVFGAMTSNGSWNDDNDVIFTISNKRNDGFDLAVRELSSNKQNVSFDFMIIEKITPVIPQILLDDED